MYCPKCGTQNPDGSHVCNSCGSSLSGYSTAAQTAAIAKTSGFAIAALVCGILAPFTCGITGILAIIFGIIALVEISKSSGVLKGIGMAIVGIILPGVLIPILLMMAMLMPALSKVRILAQRTVCASNMAGLYKSLLVYSQDFDGKYPTADKWCDLLIEYADVSKQQFICKAASGGSCNYAMNKNIEKLGPNAPPDMVLLFETSPGWNQAGGAEILSTENHKGEGCNILSNNGHVEFVITEDLDKLKWKPED